MKLSPLLLAAALLTPATLLAGAAAPVALGVAALLGLGAIGLQDYQPRGMHYAKALTTAPHERLPLAA